MILAADLGSTNFKAAVFAPDGRRIGEATRAVPYEVRTNERSELCPAAVAKAFDEVVVEAVRSAGVPAQSVRTASFTSQAQTFCVCDAEGNPCGPLIGWSDCRAGEEAALLQKTLGPEFHRQTGWPDVQPGHLIAKALWWNTRKGLPAGKRLVSLPSFLAMQSGAPLVSDRNLAAMTGFFSIPKDRWWPAALDAAGVQAEQLGRIVVTGEHVVVETRRARYPLPALQSIVMAGNDHTAGAVGCGCSAERSVLTLGTAGVFYRHAGKVPGPFTSDGLWGPYPGGGYYELRYTPHACSALDWADEFLFGSINSTRFVERASHAPEGSEGVVFDPNKWGTPEAWAGEGSPEDKARAVLEGIGRDLHKLVNPHLTDGGCEIVLLGGGSRLEFWVRILEKMFGCPLRRTEADGLKGAARLALSDQSSLD